MRYLIAVLLLTSCVPFAKEQTIECTLPADYAIRSSCPFTTAVINNECYVVCYDYAGKPLTESAVQCTVDGDCICPHFSGGECACINNQCAAVMAKIESIP
jgi:hypothetical protein